MSIINNGRNSERDDLISIGIHYLYTTINNNKTFFETSFVRRMNVVPILNNIIRQQSEGEARDLFLFTN